MTLKLAQFCDDPKKNIHKILVPQKMFIFLETPKNIEIQNFEPKKMDRAYVCVKISEYPPLGGHYGENFCEIVLILHQWFRRRCCKIEEAWQQSLDEFQVIEECSKELSHWD